MSRRAVIGASIVGIAAMAVPDACRKIGQDRVFIRLEDAVNKLPAELRTNIMAADGEFDRRVKDVLSLFNSFQGKRPNELFVCGTALADRRGLRFELDSKVRGPFSVDLGSKVIVINRTWVEHNRSQRGHADSVLCALAAVGGAFAYLSALHEDRLMFDKNVVPRLFDGITHDTLHTDASQDLVAQRAAPMFVALLVAERMLAASGSQDLHEWHLYSKDELLQRSMTVSTVEDAIGRNFERVFGVECPYSAPTMIERTSSVVRVLMHDLRYDQRTIGRLTQF